MVKSIGVWIAYYFSYTCIHNKKTNPKNYDYFESGLKDETMTSIQKTFMINKEDYELFRDECKKRAMSPSKWIRNVMGNQLDKWKKE